MSKSCNFHCPNKDCDAEYYRTSFKIQSRDKEDHECEKCGEIFVKGKASEIFTFTLLNPTTTIEHVQDKECNFRCPNMSCDAEYYYHMMKIDSKEREHHVCEKCGHTFIENKRYRAIFTYRLLNPDSK